MARPVLLRIIGDADDARGEIRRTREELRQFSRETAEARLEVQTRAAEAQIERVKERLRRLSEQAPSPKVDIQMAAAVSKLERLEARLAKLGATDIDIDVDVNRGGFERAAAGVGRLDRAVLGLAGGFSNLLRAVPVLGTTLAFALRGVVGIASQLGSLVGTTITTAVTALAGSFGRLGGAAGPIGQVVGGVVSLGFSLGAMAATAGAAIIALNAILGAIVALGSALIALAASLTAAVGGLGALAVAFGAVLGPAVFVVIGLFQRFAAIIEARQARERALEQSVYEQKAAEEARAGALDEVADAERRLSEATVQARRAATAAIEEQHDAQLALESAQLGVREARLGVLEARRALREFLSEQGAAGPKLDKLVRRFSDVEFNPAGARGIFAETTGRDANDPLELQRRILNVQRAQLSVKEATDRVGDSERALGEARRQNNQFVKQGLRAYGPYRQALEAVGEANERLAEATDRTSRAQDDYHRKLSELSGTERGSLQRLNAFIEGFERLAKAFTDPIFRAINAVFDDLRGNAGFLERGLRQVGQAFGQVIRSFGTFLRERTTRQAFGEMADGAAHLARELGGRAFISFLRIMREVALTAMPLLRRAATGVATALGGVAGNGRGIRRVVTGLLTHFVRWAALSWQVLRAVTGIFRAAAGEGGRLARSLTTIVRKFADWANSDEGQRKLRAFFARMVERAKEIVRFIARLVRWLRDNLPNAAEKAKTAFEDMKPAAEALLAVFKEIFKTLRDAGNLWKFLSKGDTKSGESFLKSRAGDAAKLMKLIFGGGLGVHRQHGGSIPGTGRGDRVPAMLEPGEFVIRRSVVQQLGIPALRALNGGAVPQRTSVQQIGTPFGDLHMHFSVPGGGPPDPRVVGSLLGREAQKLGLVGG